MKQDERVEKHEANRDPISGEPGAHPYGVGVGTAVGGAASGAALGTVVGPVGTVLGAVAGGLAGAFAGKALAESIDPTAEDAHWREHYRTRPYVNSGETYLDYQIAYQYGWESRAIYPTAVFEDIEGELRKGWELTHPDEPWNRARHAVHDAWDRIDRRSASVGPGNSRIA
jgi:hypothetical protein